MNIVEATKSYESWLRARLPLVERAVEHKHDIMRESAFGFLRASYYRWIPQLAKIAPPPPGTPIVLAVGDLHLENFGTWRDAQARLVWGINDFDEAHRAPYSVDLVRLAASVLIAIDGGSLFVGAERACREILAGYGDGIRSAGGAFVLEEKNAALRGIAMSDRHQPAKFWKKLRGERKAGSLPSDAETLLLNHLPRGTRDIAFGRRTAGIGGLGVPRYVAVGTLDGSLVCREIKLRAPIAAAWARNGTPRLAEYQSILTRATRAADPFLHVEPGWILRRLAPDSGRIDLVDLASAAERREVLHAMGVETANIHRGTRGAPKRIARHLAKQKDGWLYEAARRMADATQKDWKVWKKKKKKKKG